MSKRSFWRSWLEGVELSRVSGCYRMIREKDHEYIFSGRRGGKKNIFCSKSVENER